MFDFIERFGDKEDAKLKFDYRVRDNYKFKVYRTFRTNHKVHSKTIQKQKIRK